jgi:hypothetical protein
MNLWERITGLWSGRGGEGSFLRFLGTRERRLDLAAWLGVSILLHVILRLGYAAPFHETDTDAYLRAARKHVFNPYRPSGYSTFLGFIHGINPHLRFILTAQFALHALSVLVLYLTALHLQRPRSATVFRVTFLLLLVLPSMLYCTNYLMSDSLFLSLTFLWTAAMLWCLATGDWYWIVASALLGLAALEVRYAGLIYPLVAAVVLGLLLRGRTRKIAAVAIHLALLAAVYVSACAICRAETGVAMFSPFGGWARANNACIVIPAIRGDARRPADPELAAIHDFYLRFPDVDFAPDSVLATYPIWVERYPAKQFFLATLAEQQEGYVHAWVWTGRQLERYGNWLIRTYPLVFFRRFILLNAKQAVLSFPCPVPRDFTPDEPTRQWLQETQAVWPARAGVLERTWGVEMALKAILWLVSTAALLYLGIRERARLFRSPAGRLIVFLGTFLAAFIGFSIVSHPICSFRYMLAIQAAQFLLVAAGATEFLAARAEGRGRDPVTPAS